jgi:hypothetical protein
MQYDEDRAVDNCPEPRVACKIRSRQSANTPLGPIHWEVTLCFRTAANPSGTDSERNAPSSVYPFCFFNGLFAQTEVANGSYSCSVGYLADAASRT